MTMIVPAGNNKPNWSPEDTRIQKTASEGGEAQDIEVDALYEAAKGVVEASEDKGCKECECDPCECEDKQEKEACGTMTDDEAIVLDVEEVTDDAEEVGEVIEEVAEEAEAQSVSQAVAEVEQKAEEAEAVVKEVSEAVEQIEEAVEAVKEVCNAGEGEEVEEEVEVEIVEDEGEEVPGEEEVDGDVIVEGEGCEASEEPEMEKSASAEEFCKYAKLSPQNRRKLKDYWTNMLGYPKDFVDLMTKDYEK